MADTERSGPSRLWRIVLVVSLALNLAVMGLVVGAAVSGRVRGGPPHHFELGLGPVSQALGQDERRAIGLGLRRDRALRDIRPRAQAEAMIDVLRTEPFDPDRLRQLLDEQSARLVQLQGKAQDLLVQTINEMTPERRAAFAESLAAEMLRSRKMH